MHIYIYIYIYTYIYVYIYIYIPSGPKGLLCRLDKPKKSVSTTKQCRQKKAEQADW